MLPCRNNGGLHSGFTLVEMLVVVAIISIMSMAVVAEMHGTFQDALLRSTGRELANAFNLASSRAISVNRPHRIRLDRLARRYVLERSTRGGSEFHLAQDIPGGTGPLDSRIKIQVLEPGVTGPDDAGQQPSEASENTAAFPTTQTEQVTFYPDGTADSRQIVLTDRDGFRLALRINPITSRVQITAMPHP
ncbi:MAG TPA: GspH/FimT family pseudopilin [Candidatus Cybelea sp.]|jgi:type II secretion system protein H|nr:GspH/FimT family pseudopilin [Candidatus Cybelea sp.]